MASAGPNGRTDGEAARWSGCGKRAHGGETIDRRLEMRTLLGIVVLVALCGCGVNTNPGSGEKVGQVVRFTEEGLFCKTWEGQLIRGGMTGGSGAIGVVPFEFTIEDRATAERIQQYMRDQTEILIRYEMEGVYSLCRTGSQGHFLVSVEPTKAVAATPESAP